MVNKKLSKLKRNIVMSMTGIIIIGGIIGGAMISYSNPQEYKITVTDKQVKRGSGKDSSDTYLVFTETDNGETIVFENTDLLFKGKFNSSDIQGQLKVGETYTVETVGYRVPFLSMHQNIVKVK